MRTRKKIYLTYVGSSHFVLRVLAHAMLHMANKALEIETPWFLHALRILLVRSSSKATVGTTVCLSLLALFGKACPPCRRCKYLYIIRSTRRGPTISLFWLFSKSTREATRFKVLGASGSRSSKAVGRRELCERNIRKISPGSRFDATYRDPSIASFLPFKAQDVLETPRVT